MYLHQHTILEKACNYAIVNNLHSDQGKLSPYQDASKPPYVVDSPYSWVTTVPTLLSLLASKGRVAAARPSRVNGMAKCVPLHTCISASWNGALAWTTALFVVAQKAKLCNLHGSVLQCSAGLHYQAKSSVLCTVERVQCKHLDHVASCRTLLSQGFTESTTGFSW